MAWTFRRLQSLVHCKYLPNKSLTCSSQEVKGLVGKLSERTGSAVVVESKLKEDTQDGSSGDSATSVEGEGLRGEAVATNVQYAQLEDVNLTVGCGVLRTKSDITLNEMGVMRWTVGKVKGRMKAEMLPVEVVPQNQEMEQWKSRNKGPGVPPGVRTYREHVVVADKFYKIKKHFHLNQLNNINLVNKEHEMIRTSARSLETIPSLLGITEEELQDNLNRLKTAGFTDEEATILIGVFPQCMVVNWNNVHGVVQFFTKDLKLPFSSAVALMEKHPYMFTQKSDKVPRVLWGSNWEHRN